MNHRFKERGGGVIQIASVARVDCPIIMLMIKAKKIKSGTWKKGNINPNPRKEKRGRKESARTF